MITESDFKIIDNEVKLSINEVLEQIKLDRPENYVLFLADGEYKEFYKTVKPPRNPYVIDNQTDRFDDETRLNFLIEFLKIFYRFLDEPRIVNNSFIRMNIELLIYTHIWESKPFL